MAAAYVAIEPYVSLTDARVQQDHTFTLHTSKESHSLHDLATTISHHCTALIDWIAANNIEGPYAIELHPQRKPDSFNRNLNNQNWSTRLILSPVGWMRYLQCHSAYRHRWTEIIDHCAHHIETNMSTAEHSRSSFYWSSAEERALSYQEQEALFDHYSCCNAGAHSSTDDDDDSDDDPDQISHTTTPSENHNGGAFRLVDCVCYTTSSTRCRWRITSNHVIGRFEDTDKRPYILCTPSLDKCRDIILAPCLHMDPKKFACQPDSWHHVLNILYLLQTLTGCTKQNGLTPVSSIKIGCREWSTVRVLLCRFVLRVFRRCFDILGCLLTYANLFF